MTKQTNAVNFTGLQQFVVSASASQGAYTTIQEAIDAADAAGGGVVAILPGIYSEDLTVSSNNIILTTLGASQPASGVIPASGAIINGSLTVNSGAGAMSFQATNLVFQTGGAAPAVSLTGANELNSKFVNCEFIGLTGTSFDNNIAGGGGCNVISCGFKASAGQKIFNFVDANVNLKNCDSESNDTLSTISGGKIFIVGGLFQDSFDISNNPGPFLIQGAIQIGLNNIAAAVIHTGVDAIYLNCTIGASSASGYVFEGNGPADSGTILYAQLATGLGSSTIDPDLTQQVITSIPAEIMWVDTTGSQNISSAIGYSVSTNAVVLTLPTTAAFGTRFSVALSGGTSWQVAQNAGQSIRFGNQSTTVGVGGSITSAAQGDTLSLVCDVADTHWFAESSLGNLVVV